MSSSPSRLYYLDALRAFAMLYGILVHVTTLGLPEGLRWIPVTSGYFRMGLFFLVSGFFAAMMLRRYAAGDFLRRRTVALLVPLATGLVFLNPVTNWLVATYHNGPVPLSTAILNPESAGLKGPGVWHLHLWFLITLFFFVATAPALMALGRHLAKPGGRIVARLASLPPTAVILLLALAIAGTSVFLRVGYHVALDPLLKATPLAWIGPTTMYYWPFYMTGMILFAYPALSDRFQSMSIPALALGILVAVAGLKIASTGAAGEVVRIVAKAFCTTTAVALFMAIFRRFLDHPTWLSKAAGYVYSVYIMHFLVIYAVAFALRPLGLGPYSTFFVVATVTYVIVFALHRHVIKPSPLLEFLLNGKPMRTQTAASPVRQN